MKKGKRKRIGAVLSAMEFAADRHRDQRRKNVEASPYINHPVALADVLWNEGGVHDVWTIVAALLHDTVEDTETTLEELEERFGKKIARIVGEVTDDKSLPKRERKRLQIEHAAAASRKARLVRLADKISNLRDILDVPPASWDPARKREYFEWAKQVVDALRGTHAGLEAIFDEVYSRRVEIGISADGGSGIGS